MSQLDTLLIDTYFTLPLFTQDWVLVLAGAICFVKQRYLAAIIDNVILILKDASIVEVLIELGPDSKHGSGLGRVQS